MKSYYPILSAVAAILLFCATGFSCSSSGNVSNQVEKPQCQIDDDCPIGKSCIANKCVASNLQPCQTSDECSSEQYCNAGFCAAIECSTQEDCPFGLSCIDNYCKTGWYVKCKTSDDCPLKSECVKGVCLESDGEKDGDLEPEAEREVTEAAEGSKEVPSEIETDPPVEFEEESLYNPEKLCQPCVSDADCGGNGNKCFADSSGTKYCFTACRTVADCGSGRFICLNHVDYGTVCYPTSNYCASTCFETGCPSGQVCGSDGKCKTVTSGTQGYCEPCSTDYDCIAGAVCMNDSSGSKYCGRDCSNSACADLSNSYCKRISDSIYQCWPISNSCNSACDCSKVNCNARYKCNPADCGCDAASDHCLNSGCPFDYDCNYASGECELRQQENCCNVIGFCEFYDMVCNTATCGCVLPPGQCQNNANCAPGETCEYITKKCVFDYCKSCRYSSDCSMARDISEDSTCVKGGCANYCENDSDCPAQAKCVEDDGGWTRYCVPISGSCSSSPDGDIDEEREADYEPEKEEEAAPELETGDDTATEELEEEFAAEEKEEEAEADEEVKDEEPTETESNCGGITLDGECVGNDLYWCNNGTLAVQKCGEANAECSQWSKAEGGDDGYWCRGIDGGSCASDDAPCMPGYTCANNVCHQSTDGDFTEAEKEETIEAEEEAASGTGQLGDPCPNGVNDCDPNSTDACLSNTNDGSSLCSIQCYSDYGCTAYKDDWCCLAISDGSQYCLPPEICNTVYGGTCSDPIKITSLPYNDTNVIGSNRAIGATAQTAQSPPTVRKKSTPLH